MRRAQAVFECVKSDIGWCLHATECPWCSGLARQFNFDFQLLQRFPIDREIFDRGAARKIAPVEQIFALTPRQSRRRINKIDVRPSADTEAIEIFAASAEKEIVNL